MTKQVLDVGNCVPDHTSIRTFIEGTFDAKVSQTHGPQDTLASLKANSFDLVLINRKLDNDYSDGIEIVRAIKADPAIANTPVMLITNYPDHQQQAVTDGAVYGFGKLELGTPETLAKLQPFLA